jgi:hypothetical protein
MYQHDVIKRMIEALGAALAKIAGLRAEGKNEEALQEVQAAYAALGLNPHLISSLQGASLRVVVGSPEKAQALSQLLLEESQLLAQLGDTRTAEQKARQASALLD